MHLGYKQTRLNAQPVWNSPFLHSGYLKAWLSALIDEKDYKLKISKILMEKFYSFIISFAMPVIIHDFVN